MPMPCSAGEVTAAALAREYGIHLPPSSSTFKPLPRFQFHQFHRGGRFELINPLTRKYTSHHPSLLFRRHQRPLPLRLPLPSSAAARPPPREFAGATNPAPPGPATAASHLHPPPSSAKEKKGAGKRGTGAVTMVRLPYVTALTTLFSYGLLFAFGQLRDFFRRILDARKPSNLKVRCPLPGCVALAAPSHAG
jgi:hypothetical protein